MDFTCSASDAIGDYPRRNFWSFKTVGKQLYAIAVILPLCDHNQILCYPWFDESPQYHRAIYRSPHATHSAGCIYSQLWTTFGQVYCRVMMLLNCNFFIYVFFSWGTCGGSVYLFLVSNLDWFQNVWILIFLQWNTSICWAPSPPTNYSLASNYIIFVAAYGSCYLLERFMPV